MPHLLVWKVRGPSLHLSPRSEKQQNREEANLGLSIGFCSSSVLDWTGSHSHPVFLQVTQVLTHRLPDDCPLVGHPLMLSSPCSPHGSPAHVPRALPHLSASLLLPLPLVNLGWSQSTGPHPVRTLGRRLRVGYTVGAPSRGLAHADALLY